jgi:hypothetical protein
MIKECIWNTWSGDPAYFWMPVWNTDIALYQTLVFIQPLLLVDRKCRSTKLHLSRMASFNAILIISLDASCVMRSFLMASLFVNSHVNNGQYCLEHMTYQWHSLEPFCTKLCPSCCVWDRNPLTDFDCLKTWRGSLTTWRGIWAINKHKTRMWYGAKSKISGTNITRLKS